MNTRKLQFIVATISLALGLGGFAIHAQASTTYLPIRSQKLLSDSHSAYTPSPADIQAIQHLDIDMTKTRDGGTAYLGIESHIDALYTFFGSNFNSQKYNFMNAGAFTLVSHGTSTSFSTGIVFNGTNAYVDTQYNPSVNASSNNSGYFVNEQTNRGTSTADILGAEDASANSIARLSPQLGVSQLGMASNSGLAVASITSATTAGLWQVQRINSTVINATYNAVALGPASASFKPRTAANVYIAARNFNGTPLFFSALHTDFAGIQKDDMSSSEISQLYNIMNTYNTAQGR